MLDQAQVNGTKDLKIKVIGVGGGGNNAVISMIDSDIKNVEYILVNTEKGILERANTNKCKVLQIGKVLTRGLGAGANPEIGEKAAIEDIEAIDAILEDADLVFVTAGLGGGTGTGAIPVIAEEAKKRGILTVGVVTKPFTFEGKLRSVRATVGLEKLKPNVNALIVISNDQLMQNTDTQVSILNAFKMTDDVLRQSIQSITELINTVGEINVDFADVQTVLSYEGYAYMGIGESEGENRIIDATNNALNNPLTEKSIDKAKGVIFNIKGSQEIELADINQSAEVIAEKVDPDANIIFGTVIDPSLGNKVEVTVVATGVEEKADNE